MALPVTITGIATQVATVGPFKVAAGSYNRANFDSAPFGTQTTALFSGSLGNTAFGHQFFAAGRDVTYVSVTVLFSSAVVGSPTGNVYVELMDGTQNMGSATTVAATSNPVAASLCVNSVTFTFPTPTLITSGNFCVLRMRRTVGDSSNYPQFPLKQTSSSGNSYSFDGTTWTQTTTMQIAANEAVTLASDAYYFFGRDGTVSTTVRAYKATAPDTSWASVASTATGFSPIVVGISGLQSGTTFHLTVNGCTTSSGDAFVKYVSFDALTDTFGTVESILAAGAIFGQTGAGTTVASSSSVILRSTGEVVAFYNGTQTKTSGTNYARLYYSRRTGVNTWSAAVQVDSNTAIDSTYPIAVLGGPTDRVHFFWSAGPTNCGLRTLSAANALNTAATNPNADPPGDVVSYNRAGVFKVVMTGNDAAAQKTLRFDSSDNPTAVAAAQAVASPSVPHRIGVDASDNSVTVVYRNSADSDLYGIKSTDDGATFGTAVSFFVGTVANADTNLSRSSTGSLYQRGSNVVIGYIVNDGGTLKYNEYLVRSLSATGTGALQAVYGTIKTTNIHTQSQAFAGYLKVAVTVTDDTTTAPDGTTTADTITNTNVNNQHYLGDAPTVNMPGGVITISVYAKAGTASWLQMGWNDTAKIANFNISSGVIGWNPGANASIEPVGNGWYRCKLTTSLSAGGWGAQYGIFLSDVVGLSTQYLGNGETIYLWGLQVEVGSSATEYVPTTTAAASSYLVIDGTGSVLAGGDRGTLASDVASLSGTGVAVATGTGVLNAQTTTASGSGVSVATGPGVLAAATSTIVCTGVASWRATGTLPASVATLVATGIAQSRGTGVLTSANCTGVGSGVSASLGTSVLVASNGTMTGSGISQSIGTSTLIDTPATIIGTGTVTAVSGTHLDPARTGPGLVLSNSNLTVTNVSSQGSSLSTAPGSATKMYAEGTPTAIGTNVDFALIGVGNSSTPSTGLIGLDAGVGLMIDGNVYYNGGLVGNLGTTISVNNWISVAVDTVAQTVQFRNITKAGSWTAAISIAALGSGQIFFGFSMDGADSWTANFDTAFIGTPPTAGYSRWDGTAIATASVTGTGALVATQVVSSSVTNFTRYSEALDASFWAGGGTVVTANATTAPDGATTAELVSDTASTGNHFLSGGGLPAAQTLTHSVYAKAGTLSWLQIFLQPSGRWANFDLAGGVVGNVSSGTPAQITSVGNGWYRCSINGVTNNNILYLLLANSNVSGVSSYSGTGSGNIYLWGTQVEVGATPTTYIPTDANSVTVITGTIIGSGISASIGSGAGDSSDIVIHDVTSPSVLGSGAVAQTFIATGTSISKIKVLLDHNGSSAGDVQINITTVDAGHMPLTVIGSASVVLSSVPATAALVEFTFSSPVAVTSGTEYAFTVARTAPPVDGSDSLRFYISSASIYAGGQFVYYTGSSWISVGPYDIDCVISFVSTGGLLSAPATVVGSGTIITSAATGTGALISTNSTLAGVGVSVSTGTGVLNSANSIVVASGVAQWVGTGGLLSATAALSGSGISQSIATGVLVDTSATIVGTGKVIAVGTGTLNSNISTATASGISQSIGFGGLLSPPAVVNGGFVNTLRAVITWVRLSAQPVTAASGPLAVVEAADIPSFVGTVVNNGTLVVVEAADTASFVGTVVNNGTLAGVEAADTPSFVGTVIGAGTGVLAATNSTLVGSGVSVSTGTGVLASISSTVVSSGKSISTGTGALASTNSTLVGSGIVAWTGTGVLTSTNCVSVGLGVSASIGTGALAATNSTIVGSGKAIWIGTGALAATNSTIVSSGIATSFGTLAVIEAPDIAIFVASGISSGVLTVLEAPDTAVFAGISGSTGTGVLTSTSTVAGSGKSISTGTGVLTSTSSTVVGSGKAAWTGTGVLTSTNCVSVGLGVSTSIGTGVLTSTNCNVVGSGNVIWIGTGALAATNSTVVGAGSGFTKLTLVATEASDAAVFVGTVVNNGTLTVTEASDIVLFTGSVFDKAALVATEAPDIPAFTGTVASIGTLSVIENPDTALFIAKRRRGTAAALFIAA